MQDIAFQKLLSSVMLDNKYDRYVKNRRTGKLDTKSLYKVNTSNKLFKRREARKNKNYSVTLVVDISGSMHGPKARMAAMSAQKLSHHLAQIGINHNIVTFNAGVEEVKGFSIKEDKRIEPKIIDMMNDSCRYYLFQGHPYYDDSVLNHASTSTVNTENGKKMYKFLGSEIGYYRAQDKKSQLERDLGGYISMEGGTGWNSDAEALRFSREKLLKQIGTKLMIFLSDGQPAPLGKEFESPVFPGRSQRDFDVKHEVDITLKSGIELYSIGIMSSDVTRYYPPRRTAAIPKIELLYPHIIHLIRLNMKRG